jgi:hypothetical protein
MTILALSDGLKGVPIYANYALKFPKNCETHVLTGQFFSNYKEYPVFNAVVCFDEFSLYFSARRSMSKHNMSLRPFLLQTRKRSLKMYYTAQQDRLIDVNCRDNTDGFYFPEMYWQRNENGKTIFRRKRENYVFKKGDILYMKISYYPKEKEGYIKRSVKMIQVNKYFDLYDTTQILDFDYGEDDKKGKK